MEEVYITAQEDQSIAVKKTALLTLEQARARYTATQYIELVKAEAKLAYAHLPREPRRKKIREAVIRAQKKVALAEVERARGEG
jgi:5-formyltetrahydrofolate cyclo-ligase